MCNRRADPTPGTTRAPTRRHYELSGQEDSHSRPRTQNACRRSCTARAVPAAGGGPRGPKAARSGRWQLAAGASVRCCGVQRLGFRACLADRRVPAGGPWLDHGHSPLASDPCKPRSPPSKGASDGRRVSTAPTADQAGDDGSVGASLARRGRSDSVRRTTAGPPAAARPPPPLPPPHRPPPGNGVSGLGRQVGQAACARKPPVTPPSKESSTYDRSTRGVGREVPPSTPATTTRPTTRTGGAPGRAESPSTSCCAEDACRNRGCGPIEKGREAAGQGPLVGCHTLALSASFLRREPPWAAAAWPPQSACADVRQAPPAPPQRCPLPLRSGTLRWRRLPDPATPAEPAAASPRQAMALRV